LACCTGKEGTEHFQASGSIAGKWTRVRGCLGRLPHSRETPSSTGGKEAGARGGRARPGHARPSTCPWGRAPPPAPPSPRAWMVGCLAPQQAAQGSGEVTVPGGARKMCRCGTLGHGLTGMAVMGGCSDSMILEVFSNLNNAMSL